MIVFSKTSNFLIQKDLFFFFSLLILSFIFIDGLEHIALTVFNIFLLFKLYRSNKTFTIFLYFMMSISMYFLPVIFHSNLNFFSSTIEHDYDYIDALIYILVFNIVLCISYLFFNKYFFRKPIGIFSNEPLKKQQTIYGSLFLMFLGLGSELYLAHYGKTSGSHGIITSLTEIANLLTSLKIASLLLIGFYIKHNNSKDLYIYTLYFLFLTISFIFAVNSGLRSEPIIILLALGYNHIETIKRYKLSFGLMFIMLIPMLTLMFPIFMISRNNSSMDLIAIYIGVMDGSLLPAYWNEYKFINVFGDIILDRMNLIRIIQVVLGLENNIYHSDYLQNIVNNIPRFLWENKPYAGVDGNRLGRELGILHHTDKNSSIGLTVIGESFYQLKYYGFTIAVLQGAIFSFFDKKLSPINVGAFILYFIVVINIVTMGTYLFVIPKIIKILIIYFLVIFPIGLLKFKFRFK